MIVPELSRLARSIPQIYEIIQFCVDNKIGLHILKQNIIVNGKMDMQTKIMINVFSMVAELERDFISLRTKEALAARKAAGVQLGRPRGSKLDERKAEIDNYLSLGINKSAIAKLLGVSRSSLYHYLEKME